MAEIMSSGCTRFLKKHPIYDVYYVAASRVGKDKVAHCLREMKLAQDRQVLRRQSQLRDQGNISLSSYTIHIKNEMLPNNLQGSTFNDYSALQKPSSVEAMLMQGNLKMNMVPDAVDNDTIMSHATHEKLNVGRATSNSVAGSNDIPPAPASFTRAGAPFEPASASHGWLTSAGPVSSSCAAPQHPSREQWSAVEPRNLQEMKKATGFNSPEGTRFLKFFREQAQHQE
jgi:hypothetical protein